MAPSILERFEKKYQKLDSGCWKWTGALDNYGYGRFYMNGKYWQAHRASVMIYTDAKLRPPGEKFIIGTDTVVCHSCDYGLCVNPDHLFLGTQKDNVHDMLSKGRNYSGDQAGENNGNSKLSDAQVADIRTEYASGTISQRTLGEKYGVSGTQISKIIRNLQRVLKEEIN